MGECAAFFKIFVVVFRFVLVNSACVVLCVILYVMMSFMIFKNVNFCVCIFFLLLVCVNIFVVFICSVFVSRRLCF